MITITLTTWVDYLCVFLSIALVVATHLSAYWSGRVEGMQRAKALIIGSSEKESDSQ